MSVRSARAQRLLDDDRRRSAWDRRRRDDITRQQVEGEARRAAEERRRESLPVSGKMEECAPRPDLPISDYQSPLRHLESSESPVVKANGRIADHYQLES